MYLPARPREQPCGGHPAVIRALGGQPVITSVTLLLHSDRRAYRAFAPMGTAAGVLVWPFVLGLLGWLWNPAGVAVGVR
ncbi:hypothetical protein ACWGDX_30345 [Streptomyces sp. NPDC055025]